MATIKKTYPYLCAALVMVLIAMRRLQNPSSAKVQQIQGVYIFTDSKPSSEYKYLGTVEGKRNVNNPQYTTIRDILIKRCKEQYPAANAIILNLNSGGRDNADAIEIEP